VRLRPALPWLGVAVTALFGGGVVAINLALILPSAPAAVGVFDAATVVALSAFDVDRSTALSAASCTRSRGASPRQASLL
jgi:hypothetical protein